MTVEQLIKIYLPTNQDRAEYITLELADNIDYSDCPLDLQGFLEWFNDNNLWSVLEAKLRLMELENPHCNCGICPSIVPCNELIVYPSLDTSICENCYNSLKEEYERNK